MMDPVINRFENMIPAPAKKYSGKLWESDPYIIGRKRTGA
jgi:hypothetical protein